MCVTRLTWVAVLVGFVGVSRANLIHPVNYSFEDPPLATPGDISGINAVPIPGWSCLPGYGNVYRYYVNPNSTKLRRIKYTTDGTQLLRFLAPDGVVSTASFATLQSRYSYSLAADIVIGSCSNAGTPSTYFAGTIELWAHRSLSDLTTGVKLTSAGFNILNIPPRDGATSNWDTMRTITTSVPYQAMDNNPYLGWELSIRLISTGNPDGILGFDNVRIETAHLPEPAAAVLLLAGLPWLLSRRRAAV